MDALARSGRIERALKQLAALHEKLRSPRTRYRAEAKVAVAEAILPFSTCRCSLLSTQCYTEALAGYRSTDRARDFLVDELAMTFFRRDPTPPAARGVWPTHAWPPLR